MNPTDYKTYFEEVATNNIAIGHTHTNKHFCAYSLEEVLTGLKNIKSPCLALEEAEYSAQNELSDNVGLTLNGAALILKKLKESGNYLESEAARKEMFTIAWEVFTKLRNDRKKANMGTATGVAAKLRDISNIRLIPVGPVFDGWSGWRIEFITPTNINPDLDETKWINETKFSI